MPVDSASARHVHGDERPIRVAGRRVWSRDFELPTGQQSRLPDRDQCLARSGAIGRRDSHFAALRERLSDAYRNCTPDPWGWSRMRVDAAAAARAVRCGLRMKRRGIQSRGLARPSHVAQSRARGTETWHEPRRSEAIRAFDVRASVMLRAPASGTGTDREAMHDSKLLPLSIRIGPFDGRMLQPESWSTIAATGAAGRRALLASRDHGLGPAKRVTERTSPPPSIAPEAASVVARKCVLRIGSHAMPSTHAASSPESGWDAVSLRAVAHAIWAAEVEPSAISVASALRQPQAEQAAQYLKARLVRPGCPEPDVPAAVEALRLHLQCTKGEERCTSRLRRPVVAARRVA